MENEGVARMLFTADLLLAKDTEGSATVQRVSNCSSDGSRNRRLAEFSWGQDTLLLFAQAHTCFLTLTLWMFSQDKDPDLTDKSVLSAWLA